MIRALREILLLVSVTVLVALSPGILLILAAYATGEPAGYAALWTLVTVASMAFFPLAATATLARLVSTFIERVHAWRLTGTISAGLMTALVAPAVLSQPRERIVDIPVLFAATAIVMAGAAAVLLTLANNWFDRRRNRQV